jgi:hypothetical protein
VITLGEAHAEPGRGGRPGEGGELGSARHRNPASPRGSGLRPPPQPGASRGGPPCAPPPLPLPRRGRLRSHTYSPQRCQHPDCLPGSRRKPIVPAPDQRRNNAGRMRDASTSRSLDIDAPGRSVMSQFECGAASAAASPVAI